MARTDWQEIEAWHAASGMNMAKTAAHFGIPTTTLRSHFKKCIMGGENRNEKDEKRPANDENSHNADEKRIRNDEKNDENTTKQDEKTTKQGEFSSKSPSVSSKSPSVSSKSSSVSSNDEPNPPAPLTAEQILGEIPLTQEPSPRRIISIKLPRSITAELVAEIIHRDGTTLYRHAEEYVTVEPHSERPGYRPLRTMDESRFTTWVEKFISWRQNSRPDAKLTSISEQQARFILKSDILRERTPEILEISPVRLPIITRTGTKCRFNPAPIGLDPQTGIYTQDTLPIAWNTTLPIHTCTTALEKLLEAFPFDGRDESFVFCKSRTAAAVVTAMLGQFLHHSIRKFPMILSLANKSGTGKSFLIETILAPVHGPVDPTNYNTDESEMRKTLNSKLMDGAYYCYLDDIPSLTNNTINRYVTSNNCITDRILGTNQTFSLPNRMQFLITGNNLKTAADISRRALPLDLHYAGLIRERTITSTAITPDKFRDPAWRADILQILWSLCKHWEAAGCPQHCTTYPSDFAEYDVCAHIAMHAGLADPWGPRQIALDTGDARGEAVEDLIVAAADTIQPVWDEETKSPRHTGAWQTFDTAAMLKLAEDLHILEIIIPPGVDKARSLGLALRPLKGDTRTDTQGRKFQINDKHEKTRNLTRITILTEPTHAPADSSGTAPEEPTTRTTTPPAPDPADDPFAPLPSIDLPK